MGDSATDLTAATANELDVEGEAALYRAMRHFWHPVARSEDVGLERPYRAVLLGEPVVLVRLGDRIRAFPDLCVHRGTALSLGWIEDDQLRCAYHGWTYGPDGVCTQIPARFGANIPSRARLRPLNVEERSGLVWVCLADESRYPIPEFPEFDDPSYRVLVAEPYDWDCSAPRRMENFVDFAHFAWVHDGLLGSREHPEVPEHDVWRDGPELRFYQKVVEPLQGATKQQLHTDADFVEVENTYRLTMPFTIYLNRKFPGENHYILVMTASPAGPKLTRSFWYIARNYALDQPDEDFVRFEDLILQQDRPVVESQRPEELPEDLSAELHIRGVDKVSLEYRKWLIGFAREERDRA
jgi:phenylpropionate dioxygenase-like ring-hydroxylating dioxygenase large terminal subunit